MTANAVLPALGDPTGSHGVLQTSIAGHLLTTVM
jgi:hypothetical protein